jgi:signal transduction histidine kinase
LRVKYAQLAEKYTSLVKRLEQRTQHRSAVFRLGWFGFRAGGGAMALVEQDSLTLANHRWRQLASRSGPYVRRAPGESDVRRYPDLSTLAVQEANAALASVEGTLVELFDSPSSETSLEIRIEVLSRRDKRVVVLASDVTENVRRETELLQTREALLEKEHLRVLGEMTTSVTHELGSTLRGIQARLDALATDPDLAGQRRMFESLYDYVGDALARLRELHRLARSGRLTPVPVQIADIVEQAASVLRLGNEETPQVDVQVKLDGMPPVTGTPPELSHLFITLLRNARDAMPNGGRISVVGRIRKDCVIVCVRDEGSGIAADVMPRLFEPFFTTKAQRGTGLGLWLAASTMRRLGGTIRAVNRRTGGAEFILRFPLRTRGAVKKAGAPPGARRPRTQRRVPA